jgi:hypothetical protein
VTLLPFREGTAMSETDHANRVTDGAPNRVTDEPQSPPSDAQGFGRKFLYYRHLIKVPEAVVRSGQVRCPYCRGRVERCLNGYSGLGPSLLRCHRCGEVMLAHRREWAEMSRRDRFGFVCTSLAYAMLSLVTGYFIAFATGSQYRGTTVVALIWLILLSPVAVIAIQAVRVLRSVHRTRRGRATPQTTGFWTLDLGMQWKFLLLQTLASIVLPPICQLAAR